MSQARRYEHTASAYELARRPANLAAARARTHAEIMGGAVWDDVDQEWKDGDLESESIQMPEDER